MIIVKGIELRVEHGSFSGNGIEVTGAQLINEVLKENTTLMSLNMKCEEGGREREKKKKKKKGN